MAKFQVNDITDEEYNLSVDGKHLDLVKLLVSAYIQDDGVRDIIDDMNDVLDSLADDTDVIGMN